MKVDLQYGRGVIRAELPEGTAVLELGDSEVLAAPGTVIADALASPIGTVPFETMTAGRKSACIVISDRTRPMPNKLILPELLKVLDARRIDTTILIACGTHSPTVGADLVDLVGPEIVRKYRIVNHDCNDPAGLTNIGKSRGGVDIWVNSLYLKADLKILTGFIEPHFMAGYSGGRKSVCPGILGMTTMQYAHSPEVLESECSAPGVLEGNPLHIFALEVARKAGVDFILNVTLNRDKQITGVFAGDLEKAHLAGTRFCEEQCARFVDEPVDIVVTTAGGYPLDQDFYQTVKGMFSALEIIRPGGTIITASECSRGIGSEDFKRLPIGMEDHDQFIRMLSQPGYFCIDQWEVEELIKVLKKARAKLFSGGISPADIRRCHVEPVSSVEDALASSLREYGPGTRIAAIPSGPYVLARLRRKQGR